MDWEKHGSSDNSSDQENGQPSSPESSNDGTGRSYECTFCKRGFTNAQALGGHMNIHRKDKAKAKAKAKAKQQETLTTSSTKSNNEDHFMNTSSRRFGLASNEQPHYGYSSIGVQMDCHQYYSPSNPNFPYGYSNYCQGYLGAPQPDQFYALHEEHFNVRKEQPHYGYSSIGVQMDCHQYYSPSNPNFPYGYSNYCQGYLGAPQPDQFYALHEEHFNVRKETSEMENSTKGKMIDGKEDWFENELDLELRLGHYP